MRRIRLNKKISIVLIVVFSILLGCLNSIKINASDNGDYQLKRDTKLIINNDGTIEFERTDIGNKAMGEADTWTMFIYMTGTNLESKYKHATSDIEEMIRANANISNMDKVNIIIQTGGCKEWSTSQINNNNIQRFKISNGTMELLYEDNLRSMGESDNLYDFLEWGLDNYAAEHMSVVFWNHGGGVTGGVCLDEVFNDDPLTVNEFEFAFAKLAKKMTDKFEFIGFDTCLAGTLEYANILTPYADYMIASANAEPGKGWYYTNAINKMLENPDVDGLSVAKIIIDDFHKQFNETGRYDTTLGVFNLSETDDMCKEYNYFAKYLYDKMCNLKSTEELMSIVNMYKDIETYVSDNRDIGLLMKYLDDNYNVFNYDTTNFRSAMEKFIEYSKVGSKYEQTGATGLAVYTPYFMITTALYNEYRNIGFSPYWFNYIEIFNALQTGNSSYKNHEWEKSEFFFEETFEFLKYSYTEGNAYYEDEKALKLISSNELYAEAGFANNWFEITHETLIKSDEYNMSDSRISIVDKGNGVVELNANTQDMGYMIDIYGSIFTKNDDRIICYGENEKSTYDRINKVVKSKFDGKWFMLPDGQVLSRYIVYSDDTEIIYEVPLKIDGEHSAIRVRKVINDRNVEYDILGIWDAYAENYAARGYIPLKCGMVIEPIYNVYNVAKECYEISYGNSYVVDNVDNLIQNRYTDERFAYGVIANVMENKYIFQCE